ncbi:MAG: TRAP transporter small permease subunit [Alsobacter sp.]
MAARLLAGFDRAVAILAGALLVALLGIVTLGIVTRAIGRPFSWTDEMSGYLMVWVSCIGWILATRHHAHIRIRYFQDRLPAVGGRATEVAIQLALVVAGLVVGAESALLVERNLDIEAVSIPVSTAWIYAPLIPAGFVTAAQGLADLVGGGRRRPSAADAAS